MKHETRQIISLVISIIASVIDYINLTMAKSLCYYTENNNESFTELRDTCYPKYSTWRFIIEIIVVFTVVYILTFYTLKFLSNLKKNH